MFTMRISPKLSVKPLASRNRRAAKEMPLIAWRIPLCMGRRKLRWRTRNAADGAPVAPSAALRVRHRSFRRPMHSGILQAINGISFAALLFLLASGFTLSFGLMRIVNMAHGAYYLFGGYVGL